MNASGQDAEALLRLLGLARRAGKLAVGADAVAKLVARGRRPLVIVARDAGAAQAERYRRLEPVSAIWSDRLDRAQMAEALGRNDLAVVALDDPGFLRGLGIDTESNGRRARRARQAGPVERADTNGKADRGRRGGR